MLIVRRPSSVVFIIYVLTALAFTWPLPAGISNTILGAGGDGWQETWEIWWMSRAIQAGSTPYHFSTVYAPDGATNFLHSLNPIEIISVLPVQWVFGPIPAYNVACWLALALTAFGGYLLARDVTGNRLAGFVAGFALGFAPHQLAQVAGHMDVASIQFFVLGVWCLYRSFGTQARAALVWVLWSAACLAASALTHPYSLASALIVMSLMGLYWSLTKKPHSGVESPKSKVQSRKRRTLDFGLSTLDLGWRWQPAARTGLALLIGLLVVSPLLFAMAKQKAGPDSPGRKEAPIEEVSFFSADLAAYLIPSSLSPVWGKASYQVLGPIQGGDAERVVFPGYAVLALGLLGALAPATRRKALFWWLLAVLGFLISLGPTLHIRGGDTGLLMPAALFYSIPGTSILRVPARFSILVQLGLSICAALGVQAFWASRGVINHAPTARWRQLALVGILLLVGLEFFTAPYPTATYKVESWYKNAAAKATGYAAVLEVPFDRGDARPLAWQMTSGLPLAGGYMSRQPLYALSSGVPPFTDLGLNRFRAPLPFDRVRDTLCKPLPAESTYLDVMRLAKVRYLALHLDELSPDDPRIQIAERLFPAPASLMPVYKSKNLVVYDTGGGEAPASLFGAVEDTEDWMGAVEEGRFKWAMDNYARVYVWSGAEREVQLTFKLTSFAQTRDVSISTSNKVLARGSVDQTGRRFDLKWKVPKGFSTVLIAVGGQAIRPASVGLGNDKRPLTVSISDCRYGR